MTQQFAQTNIQLYEQLRRESYAVSDINRVRVAYDLARQLFGRQFRGSGKTSLAHLVGTSSILVDLHVPIETVIAGLLHAAYVDGEFGTQTAGITEQKRSRLQQAVGADTEDLILRYTKLAWRQRRAIIKLHDVLDDLDDAQHSVIVMRLANELEEYLDLGVLYCHNADDRLLFAELYGEHIIGLARRLKYPKLAALLGEAFTMTLKADIPFELREPSNPRYERVSPHALQSPRSGPKYDQGVQRCVARHARGEFPRQSLERSLPERFETQVERYPDHVAIETDVYQLSYKALNVAANTVANNLLSRSTSDQAPVAVMVAQASMPVGMLGVLKAGRIWAPLSPTHPPARLERMLEDLGSTVILVDGSSVSVAKRLRNGPRTILNIDAIDEGRAVENPEINMRPDDPACVLYTSGSTGQPKGVVHSHRTLLHLAMRSTNALAIDSRDRLSMVSSGVHIAGLTDVLRALLNGAVLLPFDVAQKGLDNLIKWLHEKRITIFHSTPTLFRSIVKTFNGAERFPDLRLIHLGGEPMSEGDVGLYRRHFDSNCLLLNNLGCTEFSGYCQCLLSMSTELPDGIVPAGYPVEDVEVTLRDTTGDEVQSDGIGEIVITSPFLAVGYWRDPSLTCARFLSWPEQSGRRSYRTGDLGRYLPDGTLVCSGRVDSQLEIRGYRVELGEVEAALHTCPRIKEAALRAWETDEGDQQLIAYVVPAGYPVPTPADLREFLSDQLPEYMIPTAFVTMEGIPKTTSGKVDRLALTRPDLTQSPVESGRDAPRTDVEEFLLELWKSVLRVDDIGILDDFFETGGDSLQAMSVVSRTNERFDAEIPLRVFFKIPTVSGLAREVVAACAATLQADNAEPQDRVDALLAAIEDMSEDEVLRQLEGEC